MRERTALEDRLGSLAKIERELDDATTLVELGEAEDDRRPSRGPPALKQLKAEGERRQLEALLSGKADSNDTYLEVHPGAGGTEADWAEMLLRLYLRWAERRGNTRSKSPRRPRRRRRHQARDLHRQGPKRLRLAEGGSGHPPIGAHLAV